MQAELDRLYEQKYHCDDQVDAECVHTRKASTGPFRSIEEASRGIRQVSRLTVETAGAGSPARRRRVPKRTTTAAAYADKEDDSEHRSKASDVDVREDRRDHEDQ